MINHLSIIIIGINFYVLTRCSTVQTHKIDNLKVCYFNDIQNNSILVWFTIEESLNDTFDFYRFILRPSDNLLSSNIIIEILTNFTKLVDFNNSLHMFNLDSGQYEVCIEFQSNFSRFIYQPRDGCISIQIGESFHVSSTENPAPLLIALASGIVLFFILGLVVQWAKAKRRKKIQDDQSHSSHTISAIGSRQQRDYLIKNFFHQYIDQPRSSHMHQWARNRVHRYHIFTQEQEFERPRSLQEWSRQFSTSKDQSSQPRSRTQTISPNRITASESNLPATTIYTITKKEHHQIPPGKVLFHSSTPE